MLLTLPLVNYHFTTTLELTKLEVSMYHEIMEIKNENNNEMKMKKNLNQIACELELNRNKLKAWGGDGAVDKTHAFGVRNVVLNPLRDTNVSLSKTVNP